MTAHNVTPRGQVAGSTLLLFLFCVVTHPTSLSASEPLAARRIVSSEDLCQGPAAAGIVGDYLLTNGRIKVVIEDISRRSGFAESGGNVLDMAWNRNNLDLLNQVITYFDNTFPRQAVYESLQIVADGTDGKAAIIRVSGRELRNKALQVRTDYVLEAGANYLTLRTSLTNTSPLIIRDFELGDAVQWGFSDHFAPGYGTHINGVTTTVEWLGGTGNGISYGYTAKVPSIFGPNGGNWSDPNVAKVTIHPGATATYERYMIAGTGDLGSLLPTIFQLRNQTFGVVRGTVLEENTRKPVDTARVEIHNDADKPYALAQSETDGRFNTPLPPGEYWIRVSDMGRSSVRPRKVTVQPGVPLDLQFLMSAEGRVSFEIFDETTGKHLPGKLTFRGIGSTMTPQLGPSHQAKGAFNVIFNHLGKGQSVMPPGLYEVTVSRGIEYTLFQERLRVVEGQVTPVRAGLRRVVDTTGYVSGDFHLHSINSFDSSISLEDKIISLVAEGVEFAVASDHNYITDYSRAIRALQMEQEIKSSIGNEVTVTGVMHFNVFPLHLDPDKPNNGALQVQGKTAGQLFDELRRQPGEKVIQVNHPRAGDIGYFNSLSLDPHTGRSSHPEYSGAFDAIEVFNGKRVPEAEQVLQDWYHLLNQGLTYTATGNSDSHQIVTEEAGYPRNFVWLGSDDPGRIDEQQMVTAILNRRLTVTNGPFITFTANGVHGVGSATHNRDGLRLEVSVQAAPWVDVSEVSLVANGVAIDTALVAESQKVMRFSKTYDVKPERDTWYIVIARGNKTLDPVIPPLGTTHVLPFGFTNPIWIDVDGNGKFDPP